MNAPDLCRPEAYFHFARSLSSIESTSGLLQAAVAVSLHALDDCQPSAVDCRLQALANRVKSRVRRHHSPEAILAHLHDVLFDEEGFAGEWTDYYNPLNSYLPAVLETRRGIPITLALLYKVVAERVGLTVQGINAPGHFLVRVRDSRGWILIDPFHKGQMLTPEEAYSLIRTIFGRGVPCTPSYLDPTTHAQWITRLLANLEAIFLNQGCRDDLAAMHELQWLLRSRA